jgi:hypothetical protein
LEPLPPPNSRAGISILLVKAAAPAVGRQVLVMSAASEREFEPAFAKLVRPGAGALLVIERVAEALLASLLPDVQNQLASCARTKCYGHDQHPHRA